MSAETVGSQSAPQMETEAAQIVGTEAYLAQTQPARPAGSLRAWQRRALTKYLSTGPQDFLAVATPGAGKTTFALRVASELLRDRTVDQVTVVAPTEHLKHQWAESAARNGIALDSYFSNSTGQTSSDYQGVVVTYAQVASTRSSTGSAPRAAARWSSSTRSTTVATRRAGVTPSARHSVTPPAVSP